MPRMRRISPADVVVHVINRANDRRQLFAEPDAYAEFVSLVCEAGERIPMRVCAFCLMPNHWHLVLWPPAADCISSYLHWLSCVHGMRIRRRSGTVGDGHVYQDRFKMFPVETGVYYWNVLRYVEANPVRASLVADAREWPWSSLFDRLSSTPRINLTGPMRVPADWPDRVNAGIPAAEVSALRRSAEAGTPYGSPAWVAQHPERRLRRRASDLAP